MADVLIVDEDPEVRTMLGWYLSLQGHEARGAGSATEALDTLVGQTPDAIVLDVDLPGMNGHDLLAVVRAQGLAPDAAIVVLTARQDEAELVRSWELGVSAHFAKPADPSVIAEAVAMHLAPRPLALTS